MSNTGNYLHLTEDDLKPEYLNTEIKDLRISHFKVGFEVINHDIESPSISTTGLYRKDFLYG